MEKGGGIVQDEGRELDDRVAMHGVAWGGGLTGATACPIDQSE